MKTIITAIIAFSVIGATAASAGNGRSSSRNFDRPMRLGANFDTRDTRSSIAPTDARDARVLDAKAFYAQLARERF